MSELTKLKDYPLIKMEDFAPTIEVFHDKINSHKLPIPCTLQIGGSKVRIHSGDELCVMNLGMLLMMEAQEHFNPEPTRERQTN